MNEFSCQHPTIRIQSLSIEKFEAYVDKVIKKSVSQIEAERAHFSRFKRELSNINRIYVDNRYGFSYCDSLAGLLRQISYGPNCPTHFNWLPQLVIMDRISENRNLL